ncbi:zinc finger AN1 domain-containing stress-associated protein 15-like [Phalaenopsis equestris]|uniref:zinc finger AN1 domain-containing stress-associated protein 15-like n=1 Tax=Phalaenopsis equestris TaxID=78828 RepID=UPI0009E2342C|nr:zinc finger AN1 domain-containing stress-associated protein 15-like [Phalaenopsis equestris]
MARESCNLDQEEAELLKPPPTPLSPSPPPSNSLFLNSPQEIPPARPKRKNSPAGSTKPDEESRPSVRPGIRCASCWKRVGLTGFRCRCGDLFCSRHRYSETHNCSFDYKAAGREAISRANPLIRAAKIIKI